MEQNEDYKLDKWDTILSIIFILGLCIGMAVIGILVYVMIQENQLENAMQLKQSIFIRSL